MQNVHIPWIKINLVNNISLTWRANPDRPDYFTSLTNTRTIDQASKVSLNITYCPSGDDDCNMIEKAIAESPVCTLQYGDNYGDRSVTSKIYQCLIYSYHVVFNEGFLSYSFELVSHSVVHNFDKCEGFTIPRKVVSVRGNSLQREVTSAREISDDIKYVVDTYLGDYYEYDQEVSEIAIGTSVIFKDDPIVIGNGLSPMKTILALVNSIPHYGDNPPTRIVEVEDALNDNGKGTIRVVKLENLPTETYSFEWGTKKGSVLSWNPSYDGSAIIFSAHDFGIEATTTYDVNTGKPVTITFDKASLAAGEAMSADSLNTASKVMLEENEFLKLADFAYQASLTVLGEDKFISPASTKIKVVPIIMGKAHHSAGTYAMKSITDKVSSNGFTTTYDLYRDPQDKKEDKEGEEETVKPTAPIYYNGKYMDLTDFQSARGEEI